MLPTIPPTGQPINFLATIPTDIATFSVTAIGAFSYQWRRVGGPDGGMLVDNDHISGATTSMLIVNPALTFPNGSAFTCAITNN